MKKTYVKLDSRNRISLAKVVKLLPIQSSTAFCAYVQGGKIILEPFVEIPEDEAWLFKPENKHLLDQVKEGLKQKGVIKRGSFSKYLK
jgi:hypothetical protein